MRTTPKQPRKLGPADYNRIREMRKAGYPISRVARFLQISQSRCQRIAKTLAASEVRA